MPDESWVATGTFDSTTEHYVRVFQRVAGIQVDGVVGDETWNMLHGHGDNVDPQTDGRDPHTYVEESPRLEWENDVVIDDSKRVHRYSAINVGSTPVSGVVVSVEPWGPVGVASSTSEGYTLDGAPVEPAHRMYFEVTLDRALEGEEMGGLRLSLPAANGGAVFEPGLLP